MHNYVYCELSDDTTRSQKIIGNFKINAIDARNPYNRLWYKLHFIEYLLDKLGSQISYFLWLDADAVILNFNASLSRWYERQPTKHLLIGHLDAMNSGVFILKNSNWTNNIFLKYVMTNRMMRETVGDQWGEQRAFYKSRDEHPKEWLANVDDAADDLQIWRYSAL